MAGPVGSALARVGDATRRIRQPCADHYRSLGADWDVRPELRGRLAECRGLAGLAARQPGRFVLFIVRSRTRGLRYTFGYSGTQAPSEWRTKSANNRGSSIVMI